MGPWGRLGTNLTSGIIYTKCVLKKEKKLISVHFTNYYRNLDERSINFRRKMREKMLMFLPEKRKNKKVVLLWGTTA